MKVTPSYDASLYLIVYDGSVMCQAIFEYFADEQQQTQVYSHFADEQLL